jgi:hemolysin activation/secretion protein
MTVSRIPCRTVAALVVLLLAPAAALAQQHPPAPPSTVAPGALERSLAAPPTPAPGGQGFAVPSPAPVQAPSGAASILFTLNQLVVDGSTVFTEGDLTDAYADLIGQRTSLSEIFNVANAITEKYAHAGYALCFAVVPAQSIKDGVVHIRVIEGFVAKITYENKTLVASPVLAAYARKIMQSRPLRTDDLERYLLLANDIPGYTVKAIFTKDEDRNAPPGATHLILHFELKIAAASFEADNRGDRPYGSVRVQASASLRSVFGWGEDIELQTIHSVYSDSLGYYSGSGSVPVDPEGTRLSLTASYSHTAPDVPPLGSGVFTGTSLIVGARLDHPLIRSRDESLTVSAGINAKLLDENIFDTPESRDRLYVATAAVAYAGQGQSGTTSLRLAFNQGLPVFNATDAHSDLRSRTNGSGVYSSVVVDGARQQSLWGPFDFSGSLHGQWASRGLLSSEQCGYGGALFGRAFDDSELVGDSCAEGSAELRAAPLWFSAHPPQFLTLFQLYGFYDAGVLWQSGALLPLEARSSEGQSFGGGVRFGLRLGLSGSVEFAQPITPDVAAGDERHCRIFGILREDF